MTERVCVVGAGAFVPTRTISNERIARPSPGGRRSASTRRPASASAASSGTSTTRPAGPSRRRTTLGRFYPATNTDMCEVALRRALETAGVEARSWTRIFVVTCTPDELNFSHDAMELHQRLGCREDAFALVVDDGCGGTPYMHRHGAEDDGGRPLPHGGGGGLDASPRRC